MQLKPILGPVQLAFYGIGIIVGAGVYSVIGTAAGIAQQKSVAKLGHRSHSGAFKGIFLCRDDGGVPACGRSGVHFLSRIGRRLELVSLF